MVHDKVHKNTCNVCGDMFMSALVSPIACSARCRMRLLRKKEKYKAYTKEYNKRYKRKDLEKVCIICNEQFTTARASQSCCSFCSGSKEANAIAQAKYQSVKRNKIKIRARGVVNKRVKRGVSMTKQPCIICNGDAEAHHPDYTKPLKIQWLCKTHHGEVHKVS